MIRTDVEVRGVRLGDLYRDHDGVVWEVYALCTEPQASVRPLPVYGELGPSSSSESHVIGCANWEAKWAEGPLRPVPSSADRAAVRCALRAARDFLEGFRGPTAREAAVIDPLLSTLDDALVRVDP